MKPKYADIIPHCLLLKLDYQFPFEPLDGLWSYYSKGEGNEVD